VFRSQGPGRLRRWWAKLSRAQQAAFITAIIAAMIASTGAVISSVISAVTPVLVGSSNGSPAGARPKTSQVQGLGMSAAVHGRFYKVIFPVDNLQPREQQIQRISLIISFPGPACAEVPVVLYRIQSPITVGRPAGIAQGSVSAESGVAPGSEVPSIGKLNYGCGLDQLHLSFPTPGLILDSRATTPVVIDVPMRLQVTYQFLPSRKAVREHVPLPDLNSVDYLAFRVTSITDTGIRLDSCYVLSTGLYVRQGPRKCDSLVEKTAVFRPIE
jgi:hypothetical protein